MTEQIAAGPLTPPHAQYAATVEDKGTAESQTRRRADATTQQADGCDDEGKRLVDAIRQPDSH